MQVPCDAVKVTDRVYWVGAVDWTLRDFHGYATERGTSYNAYLVLAEKVTLIDAVKAPFREEMLSRIASIVDPQDIAYIVSNHAEMDHSGCLPQVIERVRPEKVFASANGVKALQAHFHSGLEITPVRDGETLNLGSATLSFIETPMLHWPDSMFTYLAEDGVLFSQDGFGMHLASSQRFSDDVDDGILEYEAAKYYANILLPFSTMVNRAVEKVAKLNIGIIAPDHGPIWRRDIARIVNLYLRWAAHEPTNKAVIVYDSMWESTHAMAQAIEEGLNAEGAQVRSLRMRDSHRSHVATELLDAGALLVGSPTLNNGLFPTVADVLTYLKGLRRKNLIGAAFGSYGWGGVAVDQVVAALTEMRVELVGEPLRVQYVPDAAALEACRALGRQVGAALRERVKA